MSQDANKPVITPEVKKPDAVKTGNENSPTTAKTEAPVTKIA